MDRPGGIDNRPIVTLSSVNRCHAGICVQEKLCNQTVLRRVIGGIEIRNLGGAQCPVPKSYSGEAALKKAAEILGPQSERRGAGLRVDDELDGLIRILKMDLAGPRWGPLYVSQRMYWPSL